MRWGFRSLATLLLAGFAGLAGCDGGEGGASQGQGPPPPVVEVETLEPEPIRDLAKIPGQLEAEESVVVRTEVEGVVSEFLFEEGQRVEKDTVLFRLRDARQRAAVHEAEARLALRSDEFRRTEELAEERVLAEAELVRVRQELEMVRAALESARVELEKTTIRAPFTGVLGARLVSPGERVSPETPLVGLYATDRLRLVYTLPEQALGYARTGVSLEVSVADHPGERFPATTYFVSPALMEEGRRILVKGWVPNPEGKLRPGQFAYIHAELAREEDAIVVPDTALVEDGSGFFVWRLGTERMAERVPVELGIRQNGRIQITSGLAAGDTIVVAGTHKVRPGAPVMPAGAKPPGANGRPPS